MSALQIRRGLKANLPEKAALGEPLIATDTRELYIGCGTAVGDAGVYKVGDIIFAATEPPVIEGKVWIDTSDNSIYRADGAVWTLCVGGGGSTVTADFTVYGVTQGSYSDGNVIVAGTSLEDVVKNMLQTIIPPTYQSPTLTLSGNGSANVEAGTSIGPRLTPSFNQRDGGAATLYTLKKGGVDLFSDAVIQFYDDAAAVLGDTTRSFQAFVTYDQGPVKNDNQGNAYPTGQIPAGTATSGTVTYTGKRNLFYGADIGVTAPADSAAVRILASKVLGPGNGTTFTINVPAGAARVVFAYPATLRDVSSVKYVELGNGEVKDTFALTTINVEGASGFTAISYKVYSYVPAIPFGDAVTYNVTI